MDDPTSSENSTIHELLELNQRLLESIMAGDWETYAALCDPTISAFEPEARGQLVEGLEFHHFYFARGGTSGPHNTTMTSPHVRLLGEWAAVVCYVRLVQRLDEHGQPVTTRCEETRVWQRCDGAWRHVHFHRSMNE
jgi:calcium/calmodulin-dependent protein kinase (CaM kinase) II